MTKGFIDAIHIFNKDGGLMFKKGLVGIFFIIVIFCNMFANISPVKIKVIADDNYPPYSFRDANGKLQGISYDLWKLWEQETGIEVEYTACDWELAQLRFNRGEADVLDMVFYSKERAKTLLFSKPYATIRVPVFYKSEINGIKDINDLSGFTIGAKAGDNVISILRENLVNNIRELNSYEDIIKAARDKKIYIFTIDEPAALYYLYKYNLISQYKYGFNLYSGEFHRTVSKDNHELLKTIDDGFSRISEEERKAVQNKWMGESLKLVDQSQIMPYLLGIGSVILITLAILFFVNILLRKQVAKKTKQLQKTLDRLIDTQSRNETLLNAIPDLLFIFNEKGEFVDFKSASTEALIASPEFFIGKNMYDVLPKYLGDMTMERIKLIRETGEIQNYTYSIIMNNIEEYYDARMVRYGTNEYLAVVRNVTLSKKAEEDRNRANKLESLGILAGGIAHDFNNILTAIIGSLSLIKMKLAKEPELYKVLGEAEKAGLRAKKLTNQLLTFAKGGNPIKESGDINELIEDSAEFVLSGTNCEGIYHLKDNVPKFDFDKGQISQVIQNLVINAIQAMPNGGTVKIISDMVRLDEANNFNLLPGMYISISVCDQGSGIPEEKIKSIFDPYYTDKVNGTGLGLTICYSIIQKHLGTIKVMSLPDKGAEFKILLPLFMKESKKVFDKKGDNMDKKKGKFNILLMDDEEQILYIGKEMLEFLEHTVDIAHDGEEAIAIFEKAQASAKKYDLIIMDLTVPGKMGGKEAILKVKEKDKTVKAIVSSGYSNDPVMANCQEYGFDGFLIKPFNLESLEKAISDVMM